MSWRIAARSVTPWTPAQISTALWLDAADASTVTTVGGAVSEWRDKSGNGRHVSQSTGGNRPDYTNSFNGRSVISFNGLGHWLENASPGLGGLSTATLFVVMRYVTINNVNDDIALGIGITNPPSFGAIRSFYRQNASTTQGFGGWGADINTTTHSIDAGNFHTFAVWNTSLASSGNVKIAKNGVITTHTASNLVNTVDGFSVGSLQGVSVSSFYSHVEIGEIVVLPTDISQNSFNYLTGYAHHRWGLTANLPSDHPYKSVAPYV